MQWFELKIICRNCRDEKHSLCSSEKSGISNDIVKVNCTCDCHQGKKQVTDSVGEPASVTNCASASEGSKVDDT